MRPNLNEIPLDSSWPLPSASMSMTIDMGAWDGIIEGAYNAGFVLIELDQHNRPIRAFQRTEGYPK